MATSASWGWLASGTLHSFEPSRSSHFSTASSLLERAEETELSPILDMALPLCPGSGRERGLFHKIGIITHASRSLELGCYLSSCWGPWPSKLYERAPKSPGCHRAASFMYTTLPGSRGLLPATPGWRLFLEVELGLREDTAGQGWGQVCCPHVPQKESQTGHEYWVQLCPAGAELGCQKASGRQVPVEEPSFKNLDSLDFDSSLKCPTCRF